MGSSYRELTDVERDFLGDEPEWPAEWGPEPSTEEREAAWLAHYREEAEREADRRAFWEAIPVDDCEPF